MTDENKKKIYEAVRNVCLRAVTGWDAEIDEDNFEKIVDEELIFVIDKMIEQEKVGQILQALKDIEEDAPKIFGIPPHLLKRSAE